MNTVTIAALLMASATALPAGDHAVTLAHASGPVDARYRPAVTVRHRQVGAVLPGGRPSTLRCLWSADLLIVREARTAAGATATRALVRPEALTGSRHGWCAAGRAAIAADVDARADELHDHVRALARDDHPALMAEVDRLHPATSAG